MLSYKQEIYRKLIHFSSLWIPVLYLYNNTAFILKILLPLVVLSLSVDIARKYSSKLNSLVQKIIGNLMRDNEVTSKNFAGATHFFLSALLTILFFDKEIAIFALTVLVISDSFAALVGRKFGKIKIMDKTLEGTIGFILSAIIIYYYYIAYCNFHLNFTQSMIAILIGALSELFSKTFRIDDNFIIPLSIAISLAL